MCIVWLYQVLFSIYCFKLLFSWFLLCLLFTAKNCKSRLIALALLSALLVHQIYTPQCDGLYLICSWDYCAFSNFGLTLSSGIQSHQVNSEGEKLHLLQSSTSLFWGNHCPKLEFLKIFVITDLSIKSSHAPSTFGRVKCHKETDWFTCN